MIILFRYGIQDETGESLTFFGGDQLTEERSRTVQNARADDGTVEERLQGIMPKFEDEHAIIYYEVKIRTRTFFFSRHSKSTVTNNQLVMLEHTYQMQSKLDKSALMSVENKYQAVKEFSMLRQKHYKCLDFLNKKVNFLKS